MPLSPLVDPSPARRPEPTTLQGRLVTLLPLDPRAHGDSLYEATRGEAGDRLWMYLFDGPFDDRKAFDAYLQKLAASEDPLFFAIRGRALARAVGYASLMRSEPTHRVIELGNIVFTPLLQQTAGATEAMYLPPLRVEMPRSQPAFKTRGAASGFHVRGHFPATYDRERPESG